MPLLKRKPVHPLPPPPKYEALDGAAEVFLMDKTGEVFVDYESYAARFAWYSRRIFQCGHSGKTGLTFYEALASEQRESQVVRERFPDELKGRVLRGVNFQMDGRLDALIERLYERYLNRYFPGEKVFVDLQGDKYYARIAKVFPPKPVRDALRLKLGAPPSPVKPPGVLLSPDLTGRSVAGLLGHPTSTPAPASPSPSPLPCSTVPNGGIGIGTGSGTGVGAGAGAGAGPPAPAKTMDQEMELVAHVIGTDMNLPAEEASTNDPADVYLYTVQLMDENSNFEGSYMEVSPAQMSRDRLTFSKSILKRYVRECVGRKSAIGSPWEVKPAIAAEFGVPMTMPPEIAQKNEAIKGAKLSKRKKKGSVQEEATPEAAAVGSAGAGVGSGTGPGAGGDTGAGTGPGVPAAKKRKSNVREEDSRAVEERREREARRAIKYPIEDLELDPMSVIDGRMLRRVSGALPELPRKPPPRRDLSVPAEHFERLIVIWHFLTVFGRALHLTPFTVDDLADALLHPTHKPASNLLGDVHGTLVGHAGAFNDMRAPGTVGCSANGVLPLFARSPEEDAKLNIVHREHWVRQALAEAKGWDKGPRRKGDDVRDRWEVRLTGCLCQRGGCETMPSLGRLMRRLYKANGEDEPDEEERTPVGEDDRAVARGGVGQGLFKVEVDGVEASSDAGKEIVEGETEAAEQVAAKGEEEVVKVEADEEKKVEAVRTEPETRTGSETGAEASGAASEAQFSDEVSAVAEADPAERYPRLDLSDKLDVLEFLCGIVRDHRIVRNAIDEAENTLTDLRKERADLNREKKQTAEELAAASGKKSAAQAEEEVVAVVSSNGNTVPAIALANGDMEEEDVDMLEASDGEPTLPPRLSPTAAAAAARSQRSASPEVDELEPSETSSVGAADAASGASTPAQLLLNPRRAAAAAKKAQKLAEEHARAALHAAKHKSDLAKRHRKDARKRLEDELSRSLKREEVIAREFRRYAGVGRMRPLGSDRFHCRYWWFDGIGAMNLVGQGGNYLWYTGRIYVSGPTEGEWAAISDGFGGEEAMLARRDREEGGEEAIVKPGEWAWYGTEADIDGLLGWLNAKGNRELALRQALRDWRDYIVGGMKRRQKQQDELEARLQEDEEASRRSNRAKVVPAWARKPYMKYHNKLGVK